MTAYEISAQKEMEVWQKKMMSKPGFFNRISKSLQDKINSIIPETFHKAITTAMKQMIRGVLFGAGLTTTRPVKDKSLEVREAIVEEKIKFYKRTAAAEGGVTGAGGILMGLADFPVLLGIKLKLLFEIASVYGFNGKEYKERLYILYIFQLAFSSDQHRKEVYLKITGWKEKSKYLPDDINQYDWRILQQEYRDYIDLAKMAQLIPVVGAPVGFVVNYRLIKKLGITAMNAYRMRWMEELSV